MTPQSVDDVRRFVLAHVDIELRAVNMTSEVPDDFDLLASGVIDSLGLLDLLGAVEDRFGFQTDFEGLDVEELTLVGPLCNYIYARYLARDER